jgi:hypothetical protein
VKVNEYEVRVTARASLSEEALMVLPESLGGYYAAAGYLADKRTLVVQASAFCMTPWSAVERVVAGLRAWAARHNIEVTEVRATCKLRRAG